MFGLLKQNRCNKDGYFEFRQNYCGTCKTIGSLYGQKERILLNYDIVFLNELLSTVNYRNDDSSTIKVSNCFDLPRDQNSIPLFLKYSASINVLLGYYKILDNIEDSNYKINVWRIVKSFETKNFRKAEKFLSNLKVPTAFIENSINEQFQREKGNTSFGSFEKTFKHYAELTGKITGEVFKHGALISDKPNLADTFYTIGEKFGEIAYLIDAIEDYNYDIKNHKFNLFNFDTTLSIKEVDAASKEKVVDFINTNLEIIKNSIQLLPISGLKKSIFTNRLSDNIGSKVSSKSNCIDKQCSCSTKKLSIKERYIYAVNTAKFISDKRKNIVIRNIYYLTLLVLLILIFTLIPNIIYASNDHIYVSTCCGTCLGDCLCIDKCGICCCGNGEITKDGCGGGHCGTEIGDDFQNKFCGDWKSCCGCIGFLACVGFFAGGFPKSETSITKVIFIEREKGCGGC